MFIFISGEVTIVFNESDFESALRISGLPATRAEGDTKERPHTEDKLISNKELRYVTSVSNNFSQNLILSW